MISKHKRKYLRELDDIGKRKYRFDLKMEKNVYKYISCYKMKEKEMDEMSDELKFDSYYAWKEYVCKKYSDYDLKSLMEFSRYLNRRIRGVKTGQSYWQLIVPVMLTISFTEFLKIFINLNFEVESFSGMRMKIGYCIVCIMVLTIIAVTIALFLKKIMDPIFYNDIESYFLMDYKEIKDEKIKVFEENNK